MSTNVVLNVVREEFTDVQAKLNVGSSFFNINFDNKVFISFEKTNLECENRFKEIIQRKEKENEDLMNKINEYERSVQAYRQKQIDDRSNFDVICCFVDLFCFLTFVFVRLS